MLRSLVQSIIKELFGSASPFSPSLSVDDALSEAQDSATLRICTYEMVTGGEALHERPNPLGRPRRATAKAMALDGATQWL